MKTCEQWIREYESERHSYERKLMFSNGDLIRAIQLDALKEATGIVHDLSRGTKSEDRAIAIDEARDAILDRIRELESSPENK